MVVLSTQINRMKLRLNTLPPAAATDTERLEETRDHLVGVCDRLKNEIDRFTDKLKGQLLAEDKWEQWDSLNWQFRALAADCLALEQSQTLRANPETAKLCTIADKLAEGFSRAVRRARRHYVLISETEHFGVNASAIHLGYGRLEIWNLNRVAHEFGHMWAQDFGGEMQTSFVEQLMKKENEEDDVGESDWNESHGKEFFADIMAAFLMGPAYAFASMVLDLNPADDSPSDSHPSGHERAQCILLTLERLKQNYHWTSRPELTKLIEDLRIFWSRMRAAMGPQTTLANRTQQKIKLAMGIVVDRLLAEIPDAHYGCLETAFAVKNELASNRNRLPRKAKGIDVLNGAWLRRWAAGPDEVSSIAGGALAMLEVAP
jgi:hypothetical protein